MVAALSTPGCGIDMPHTQVVGLAKLSKFRYPYLQKNEVGWVGKTTTVLDARLPGTGGRRMRGHRGALTFV